MTSSIESQRRRLLRHGFVFLFVAAWLGIATAVLPHPRTWMAAHLSAFFACLILVAIGLVWRELRLTDLPGPASQPGVAPPMPQAAVFFTLLAIVVPTTLVAFGLVMYGMRGQPEPVKMSH